MKDLKELRAKKYGFAALLLISFHVHTHSFDKWKPNYALLLQKCKWRADALIAN